MVSLSPHVDVDADACPMKQEVYRVATRYGLSVTLVSNSWMRTPNEPWLKLEVVVGALMRPMIGSWNRSEAEISWSPPTSFLPVDAWKKVRWFWGQRESLLPKTISATPWRFVTCWRIFAVPANQPVARDP